MTYDFGGPWNPGNMNKQNCINKISNCFIFLGPNKYFHEKSSKQLLTFRVAGPIDHWKSTYDLIFREIQKKI